MKLIIYFFVFGVVMSCAKEKNISNEYQFLIGEWHNSNGSYFPRIIFQKNGMVSYLYAGKRGFNFRVLNTNIGTTYSLNGKEWTRLIFESRNEDSALPEIGYDSPDFDTIMFEGIKFMK